MKFKSLVLVLATSLSLLACKQEVQQNVSSNEVHDHKVHKKADIRNQTGRFPGKPTAPVSMDYEFKSEPALNENMDIDLNFRTGRDIDGLVVEYHLKDGLLSMDAAQRFEYGTQPKGESTTVTIRVQPQASGTLTIYVSAHLSYDGVQQSRSFAVPVQVGGVQAVQKSSATPLAPGMRHIPEQGVISMPASKK